jgi:hypothetical protein
MRPSLQVILAWCSFGGAKAAFKTTFVLFGMESPWTTGENIQVVFERLPSSVKAAR